MRLRGWEELTGRLEVGMEAWGTKAARLLRCAPLLFQTVSDPLACGVSPIIMAGVGWASIYRPSQEIIGWPCSLVPCDDDNFH